MHNSDAVRVALFNDIIVGAIVCRIDIDERSGEQKLYIMSLSVLAAYRREGIGAYPP